ncbi:xylulokinase [Enterococcus sp. CWB-B31]|uniref:xylulokinase n=1 Tax=Enterococcus sp. CWB-B31 TaxID=2885159 RepID=UPI001E3835CA|nr:FGGY-family carbohydrate kinase [Enterococcus sp. CWB-B31]MCB5954184.1 FGGY-family carbohydrate kinase [Enterococcus sp. CWB-B31]
MDKQAVRESIIQGNTSLGIELGSTRIKAVLIDKQQKPVASGSHEWENQLIDGIWTYSLEEIWSGLQESYQHLKHEVWTLFDAELTQVGAIGFSAMMHGYMAFDKEDQLLVPFRTWRNSITAEAEKELTALFDYNIPQRWSIAHLYQAILNNETHVKDTVFFTTLAGYVHWQLTGEKVLGVGDASGMFPIDPQKKEYDSDMLEKFDQQVKGKQFLWKLKDILPTVLVAGESAGQLTEAGAKLLDPTGDLKAGIPLCPPEGDAGTGMTATNSVALRTGNISAGTSVFAMIVLEKELKNVHPELDLVTTPAGDLAAMVHANNCSSEINAWVKLFKEFADVSGFDISTEHLYEVLFKQALVGDKDCGGLLSYGYFSGENITHISEGRPLFVRTPDSLFNLANFMRVHLYSAFGALQIGMKILVEEEQVNIDRVMGHGGIFKTEGVAQRILAAAMDTPVSLMETAGEGGAWGIALLADYLKYAKQGQNLTDYLNIQVFGSNEGIEVVPDLEDVKGFEQFAKRYATGLPIEKAAVEFLN